MITKIGKHSLINDSCINTLQMFEKDTIDMFCTSPPYAQGLEYEQGLDWDGLYQLMLEVSKLAFEVTKPGGWFFVNFGETTKYEKTMAELYNKVFRDNGWVMHSRRIWAKSFAQCSLTGAMTAHTIPAAEWENIWTFRKPPNSKECHRDKALSLRGIWTIDEPCVVSRAEHPATFPVELPQKAIKVWTDEDAIVCDPFMGSGSTLVACERENRRGIGIEIDEGYYKLAIQRVQLATQGLKDYKRVRQASPETPSLFHLT